MQSLNNLCKYKELNIYLHTAHHNDGNEQPPNVGMVERPVLAVLVVLHPGQCRHERGRLHCSGQHVMRHTDATAPNSPDLLSGARQCNPAETFSALNRATHRRRASQDGQDLQEAQAQRDAAEHDVGHLQAATERLHVVANGCDGAPQQLAGVVAEACNSALDVTAQPEVQERECETAALGQRHAPMPATPSA